MAHSPVSPTHGGRNTYRAELDFERKEEEEGCCSCCIAPCKCIGLILFLPCCIYSCCKARTSFHKEAKQYKDKQGDTISVEPRLKVGRPTSVSASEVVSKFNLSAPKMGKVEPAPDKVKVIDEQPESSNDKNGIDNKEYLELESMPSSKM